MITEYLSDDDPLIAQQAWPDFIAWALSEPKVRADFEATTGRRAPSPARSTLDMMIDSATGVFESYVREFILWVSEHHWGLDESPRKVREEIQRMRLREPA